MQIEKEDCDSIINLNITIGWLKAKHPTFKVINIETKEWPDGSTFYRMWYDINNNTLL